MRILTLAFLFLVSVSSPAPAQPHSSAPDTSDTQPVRAFLYSLGATVGPMATGVLLYRSGAQSSAGGMVRSTGALLLTGGLVFGPAAGHRYARAQKRVNLGVGVRGTAVGVSGVASLVMLFDGLADVLVLEYPELSRTGRVARGVLLGAMGVAAGSALFDIATAPLSAQRHNRSSSRRVRVVPHLGPYLDQIGVHLQVSL